MQFISSSRIIIFLFSDSRYAQYLCLACFTQCSLVTDVNFQNFCDSYWISPNAALPYRTFKLDVMNNILIYHTYFMRYLLHIVRTAMSILVNSLYTAVPWTGSMNLHEHSKVSFSIVNSLRLLLNVGGTYTARNGTSVRRGLIMVQDAVHKSNWNIIQLRNRVRTCKWRISLLPLAYRKVMRTRI